MDLLADIRVPCCLGMGYCVGDVARKAFKVELHRGLDCRGKMACMLDCMFEGVTFGIAEQGWSGSFGTSLRIGVCEWWQ